MECGPGQGGRNLLLQPALRRAQRLLRHALRWLARRHEEDGRHRARFLRLGAWPPYLQGAGGALAGAVPGRERPPRLALVPRRRGGLDLRSRAARRRGRHDRWRAPWPQRTCGASTPLFPTATLTDARSASFVLWLFSRRSSPTARTGIASISSVRAAALLASRLCWPHTDRLCAARLRSPFWRLSARCSRARSSGVAGKPA
jgi:hypothetical protein